MAENTTLGAWLESFGQCAQHLMGAWDGMRALQREAVDMDYGTIPDAEEVMPGLTAGTVKTALTALTALDAALTKEHRAALHTVRRHLGR